MDFLGVHIVELLVVLLVALVVLGPAKTITMAREAGRIVGQVRRAFTDLTRVMEEEERALSQESKPPEQPESESGRPPEERS